MGKPNGLPIERALRKRELAKTMDVGHPGHRKYAAPSAL
jgi:hypothetical protein